MNIENSLIESIKSEKVGGLSADILDLGMKSIVENEALESIPFFGFIVKTYGASVHIRERLFAKKVYEFLCNIKSLSDREREEVITEIIEKKEGSTKAGEAIISLLDKCDDIKKPELIGKLFVACGFNKISVDQFLRLSNIISNLYIDDLLLLEHIYDEKRFDEKMKSTYSSLGLMKSSIAKPFKYGGEYSLKEIGEAVFESGFEIEYQFTEEAKIIASICFSSQPPHINTLNKFFEQDT